MSKAALLELADRVEKAIGPDRDVDLAIHLALFPKGEIADLMRYPRGFDGREGYAWDIQGACVLFEKRTADGRCPHNGGIPLPAYTASLDAAMTLLGRNAIQSLSYWPFVAKGYESELCCRLTLIEVTQDGFGGKHHFRADAKTPALALTAAALRARAQQESSDADQ